MIHSCFTLKRETTTPFFLRVQYILTKEDSSKPDVICLQETGGIAKLPNYKLFGPINNTNSEDNKKCTVTTLIKRNTTVIQHDTGLDTIDHILTEIIPIKKRINGSPILNIYNRPRRKHKLSRLLRKVLDIIKKQALIITGDFNAHQPTWGYKKETAEGSNLWQYAQVAGLTLATDYSYPTRLGNSVCKDTTPDLRTRRFVGKYTQNDGACVICGKETNCAAHARISMRELECEGIHPNLEGNIRPGSRRPEI